MKEGISKLEDVKYITMFKTPTIQIDSMNQLMGGIRFIHQSFKRGMANIMNYTSARRERLIPLVGVDKIKKLNNMLREILGEGKEKQFPIKYSVTLKAFVENGKAYKDFIEYTNNNLEEKEK